MRKSKQFELVFFGGAASYMPRYRRYHASIESARETASKVLHTLSEKNLPTACHMPIVYGLGCGPDGKSLSSF